MSRINAIVNVKKAINAVHEAKSILHQLKTGHFPILASEIRYIIVFAGGIFENQIVFLKMNIYLYMILIQFIIAQLPNHSVKQIMKAICGDHRQ